MTLLSRLARLGSACLIFLLAACGGGSASDHPPWYSIGGTVTGLAAGTQLVLNNNGNDPLTISGNGAFTFGTLVFLDGKYAVTIATPPTGQTCTVLNGSGTGVVADIATVAVVCSTNSYSIGVTVSGLAAGEEVTLNNNNDIRNPLTVTFAQQGTLVNFAKEVAYDSGYAVTVVTQPGAGKTCTVTNGSGLGVVADITSVVVTCSTNTYSIGGAVSGLAAGSQVTLNNNGADPVTVRADGAFTFATPVAYNSSFNVTVGTQPVGQTCTVSNGSGAGVVANITNVAVTCSTNTFTIGVTVTGLTTGLTPDQQVTLLNGGNSLVVTALQNGTLRTFSTPVVYNGSYNVTVGTQPLDKTCTVSNGTASGVVANITNVTVTCSTNTFTIGGTVSGLAAGQQVTLLNNGADAQIVAANGAYTFTTPVAYNGSYTVTVGTQPTGQSCSVANGTSAGVTANVTNVNITCATLTFTIGGTVTGLAAGQQVTLLNNGSDAKVVVANGAYAFTTPVPFNGSYAVTVGTQPTGQTCSVANGTSAGVTANVTNVNVTCATNTFTIGGTVTGLAAGEQVTLFNNGGDAKIIAANGAYTFATPVNYNGNYAVTVNAQPIGKTCTPSNASGAGVTANVANVNITCSVLTFTVGGSVSGLAAGEQVTLFNNGGDAKIIAANGVYTFATPVNYNGNYAVTVNAQPIGKTCTPSNASGAGVTANVANVNITCSVLTFTIGGSVSGLDTGEQVTLFNNGGDAKIVGAGGTYTFATPVNYNGNYAVTVPVGTQPTGKTCTPSNASGANVTANVTNVNITCSTLTFSIGGEVTGLAAGRQVTLFNNGGDAKIVAANVAYTFATPVNYNGNYTVTVGTQPTGQICSVSDGAGANVTADVTNVNITCTLTFTVGGTVTGLDVGEQVTLLNNDGDETIVTAPDVAYTFATPVPFDGLYAVTVVASPTGKTCSVSNGSGTVTANVSNANIVCSITPG